VAKSLQEWLSEGETLYNEALRQFQDLETQLEDLESRLAAKREEVNQIATVIGKPAVEAKRRAAVQIIDAQAPGAIPASRNTIAKALTGRGLG
jgi:hypothetical protein